MSRTADSSRAQCLRRPSGRSLDGSVLWCCLRGGNAVQSGSKSAATSRP